MKRLFRILSIAFIGFVGGAVSFALFSWMSPRDVHGSDAVSVANTYIVFTTLIFVGFTVLLGVISYMFSYHLSERRQQLYKDLVDGLKSKISDDEVTAISMVNTLLDNRDVVRYVDDVISKKIQVKLNEIIQLRRQAADQVRADCDFISTACALNDVETEGDLK